MRSDRLMWEARVEELGRAVDERNQLLQAAVLWLPYARGNARVTGEEAEEIAELMDRISALGGKRL